jgi:hypothetical protein
LFLYFIIFLLNCLDAAVNACNFTVGAWPLTSISERIKTVEKITLELVEQIIFWEVCKKKNDHMKNLIEQYFYVILYFIQIKKKCRLDIFKM